MTDELASQPGAVATRSDDQEVEALATDLVIKPLDFRLNLQARMAEQAEPSTNLDTPSIRKLTWEHVVSDRPEEPAPPAATTVPLPPPAQVPPPPPPPPPAVKDTVVEVQAPVEVSAPVEVPAVADAAVEELVSTDVVADGTIAPAVSSSEINRLASVPDLIVDDSPIELPPITPSGGPYVAQPNVYTPILPETVFVAVAPRAVTTNVATLVADNKTARPRSRKSSKGHMFRSFLTLILLFGLLGGGAYAVKKYVLRKAEPKWSVDLQPLATDVATARGLQFKTTVDITALPAGGYASRLAASVLRTQPGRAETWRALGLLNGDLDLEAIGRQALNDSPAFYDAATKMIYVSDDLKPYEHLYRFALHRALTTALLDQQFGWSARVAAATPAAALALRATIDADALAVANSLAAKDAPDQLAPEMLAFVQGHEIVVAPSQFAAAIAGRAGVAMRSTISATTDPNALAALEQATPVSDAVFDGARTQVSVASPPGTQGMMFWYYVLAGRIDDTQAWSAAAHWMGDSMVVSTNSSVQCVDAKVVADDAGGAALLVAAFDAWAASASPDSSTTVVPIEGNQIAVRACDPGVVTSAQTPVKVPVVFGGAAVEQALVQAATSAATQTKVDGSCLIKAARQRGTVLTSPADDPPVVAVGWQPAYVTANLDLATGCVTATG